MFQSINYPKKLDAATQKFLNDMIDVINGHTQIDCNDGNDGNDQIIIDNEKTIENEKTIDIGKKRGRPKGVKNNNNNIDKPIKKRGRPKGSKNKPKVQ